MSQPIDNSLAEATDWFVRVRSESARVEDLPELKHWMEIDPRNALAYQQVSATWETVGTHASAAEIMVGRRDALDDIRRAARHRWSLRHRLPRYTALAASILIALVGATTWLYGQRGVYATDLGERRTLTLQDGSVVTLDARSRIRVGYQENARLIALERGQARFDVAKDPTRPFRVKAGNQTIVALGTQFNVELVAGSVLVTMIEGHIAVTGVESGALASTRSESQQRSEFTAADRKDVRSTRQAIELEAGEGLRVLPDGLAVVMPQIDIERVTAWQSGKMFFDNEPLASAVERVNRYSRDRIEVDPAVAAVGISGIFNAGDSAAFIEAVTDYFPVQAQRTGAADIHLTARN